MATLTPSVAAIEAISQPMKPPPSTIMLFGSRSRARNARLSTIRSCVGMKSGVAEVEPVAMIVFFAPIVASPSTAIVSRSLNAAVPENCLTPLAVSSCFTPPRS